MSLRDRLNLSYSLGLNLVTVSYSKLYAQTQSYPILCIAILKLNSHVECLSNVGDFFALLTNYLKVKTVMYVSSASNIITVVVFIY